MELSRIAKITNLLLKALIGLGIVSLLFVRRVIHFLLIQPNLVTPKNETPYTLFFIVLILAIIFIVYQVTKIFTTLSQDSPFVQKNEIALKKIAVACEFIALISILKVILDSDALTLTFLALSFVFGIVGLCAYVFSQLFKMSVFLKEENDMTI